MRVSDQGDGRQASDNGRDRVRIPCGMGASTSMIKDKKPLEIIWNNYSSLKFIHPSDVFLCFEYLCLVHGIGTLFPHGIRLYQHVQEPF